MVTVFFADGERVRELPTGTAHRTRRDLPLRSMAPGDLAIPLRDWL
jgi:hypothetical protein